MAVVLTILKILGIILLCIIGLLILLLLLVLFVPVRYRVEGGYSEEDIAVDLKVRWLFFRVLGSFTKSDGLKLKAKAAFVTVYSMDGKPDKDKKHAEKLPENGAPPALPPPEEASAAVEGAGEGTVDPEIISDEDVLIFGDGKPKKETKEEKKARKQREKEEKKRLKEAAKADTEVTGGIEGEVETGEASGGGIRDKLGQFRDKAESTTEKLRVKRSHIEQFLAKPFTKKTIERGKKLLIKIFRHLKPKKGHIDLTMGLGSAADTGMILGKIAMFYPLYGKWLFITPDFYYKRIEAGGMVKGRIRIGALALPALMFYLKKDTRRTIKLAKKI